MCANAYSRVKAMFIHRRVQLLITDISEETKD